MPSFDDRLPDDRSVAPEDEEPEIYVLDRQAGPKLSRRDFLKASAAMLGAASLLLAGKSKAETQGDATLPAHAGGVYALAIRPGNQTLVSAGADGGVRCWNIGDHTCIKNQFGHKGTVRCLAFTSAGNFFATAGEDIDASVEQRSQ